MKLSHSSLAVLALAGACSVSLAQTPAARPYFRNHQATPGASMNAPGAYSLREDMDGTVVSERDAAQACDVLSDLRKRESCAAKVSSEVLRDNGATPMDQDNSSVNGRTRRGSDYGTTPTR